MRFARRATKLKANGGLHTSGDLFILFRAASADGQAPRLAKYLTKPDNRFLAVEMNGALTYTNAAGMEPICPIFCSIEF